MRRQLFSPSGRLSMQSKNQVVNLTGNNGRKSLTKIVSPRNSQMFLLKLNVRFYVQPNSPIADSKRKSNNYYTFLTTSPKMNSSAKKSTPKKKQKEEKKLVKEKKPKLVNFASDFHELQKNQLINIQETKKISSKMDDSRFLAMKMNQKQLQNESSLRFLNDHFKFLQKQASVLYSAHQNSQTKIKELESTITLLLERRRGRGVVTENLKESEKISILENSLRDAEIKNFRLQKSCEYKDQEISRLRSRLTLKESPIKELKEEDSPMKCNGECERATSLSLKLQTLQKEKRLLQQNFKKEYVTMLQEVESLHSSLYNSSKEIVFLSSIVREHIENDMMKGDNRVLAQDNSIFSEKIELPSSLFSSERESDISTFKKLKKPVNKKARNKYKC